VHKVSGLPKLDVADPNAVYKTIMDPTHASLRRRHDPQVDRRLQKHYGFDISGNPASPRRSTISAIPNNGPMC